MRTYLRINRVGLVGVARLSPEQTGKVGTAARPGSGDAVGRAAPDLLERTCGAPMFGFGN